MSHPKVAIVHDWLFSMRGGEYVLEELLRYYPDADLYTLFHRPERISSLINNRLAGTSILNSLPGVARYYKHLLPLYPLAVNSLNLSNYDLVISISHAGAKNIHLPPNIRHISYCLTPMRYIFDQAESYFGGWRHVLQPVLAPLRRWDIAGAKRITAMAVISRFVAARVRKYYGFNPVVVYPPIRNLPLVPQAKGDYFLTSGAMVPYKGCEEIIDGFVELGLPLKVVGEGPLYTELKTRASDNITFVGRVSDDELGRLYSGARALIFAAREDFGLVPVEAMAAGTPVIAKYHGAVRESMVGPLAGRRAIDSNQDTALFYHEQRGLTLKSAVQYFINNESAFSPQVSKARATLFSATRFKQNWASFVEE